MTPSSSTSLCESAEPVLVGRNMSLARPPSNIQFTIAYFIFGHILVLSCLVSWFKFKDKFERTRIRPSILVLSAALCSLVQMNFSPLQVIVANDYPCWLGVVLNVMVIPLGASAILGRVIFLSFNIQFAQSAYKAYHDGKEGGDERTDLLIMGMSSFRNMKNRGQLWCWNTRMLVVRAFCPRRESKTNVELFALRFLVSITGMRLVVTILVFPFVLVAIILIAVNPVFVRCTNCAVNGTMFLTTVIVIALFLGCGIMLWLALSRISRNMPDRWGLRTEAFYSLLFAFIALLGLALVGFDDSNVYPYSHQFMLTLGIWLSVIEQSVVQLYLGHRDAKLDAASSNSAKAKARRSRSAVALRLLSNNGGLVSSNNPADLTSTPVDSTSTLNDAAHNMTTMELLEGILKHKSFRKEFEQHLVSEFAVESLFFITDVEEWQMQYSDVTPNTRLARARRICKAYIVPGALYSINIAHDVSEPILRALRVGRKHTNATVDTEANNSDVDRTVFDEAVHEVKLLLANGAVMRFCSLSKYADAAQQTSSMSRSALSLVSRVESSAGPAAAVLQHNTHFTNHHL